MQEILPISISPDNGTISVPNTVQGLEGETITFGGDIIASKDGRVNRDLYVDNKLTAKDVMVENNQSVSGDMEVIGNLSGDEKGLKIKGSLLANDGAKVEGDLDVNGTLNVTGDLNVKNLNVKGGKITVGTGDAQWTLEATGNQNWLEFYNQNRRVDNHGMVLMTPEGDIWNNQTGWATEMNNQVTQAKSSAAAASKKAAAKKSGGGGMPGMEPVEDFFEDVGEELEDFFVDDVGGFFSSWG